MIELLIALFACIVKITVKLVIGTVAMVVKIMWWITIMPFKIIGAIFKKDGATTERKKNKALEKQSKQDEDFWREHWEYDCWQDDQGF